MSLYDRAMTLLAIGLFLTAGLALMLVARTFREAVRWGVLTLAGLVTLFAVARSAVPG